MGEILIAQRETDKTKSILEKLSTMGKNWSSHAHKMRTIILEWDGNYTNAIEGYKGFYGTTFLLRYAMRDYFLFWRERFRVDYNIARIYEKMGDKDKAVEHYEKFLELAKNADEGLVEVEDARKRLAELKIND
jgi:tetratricopeptide (TPR) repeat protein